MMPMLRCSDQVPISDLRSSGRALKRSSSFLTLKKCSGIFTLRQPLPIHAHRAPTTTSKYHREVFMNIFPTTSTTSLFFAFAISQSYVLADSEKRSFWRSVHNETHNFSGPMHTKLCFSPQHNRRRSLRRSSLSSLVQRCRYASGPLTSTFRQKLHISVFSSVSMNRSDGFE